jgi:outer membrane protein assembly factor BamE (lipoprotein component of BamABCDE complex)
MKTRSRKRIIVIVIIALVALFGLELGREQLVYLFARDKLEHGYWKIRPGMTREQVTEALGQPDRVQREGTAENWYWLSREYQGWLWKTTGLASLKKHYELSVTFNEQKLVADFYGELK